MRCDKMTVAGFEAALEAMRATIIASPAVVAAAEEHAAAGDGVRADDIATESLLSSRFVSHLAKCAVRPSPTAGVGVFAEADIAPGELVTFYPGDAITYLPPGISSEQAKRTGTRGVIWGLHVPEHMRQLMTAMEDYALNTMDDTYGVVGLRALDDDMAYVGHLINDGACLGYFGSVAEYVRVSRQRANVGHSTLLGCHTATIATRAIAPGEELFVTYGPRYWRSKQRRRIVQASQVLSSCL